MEVDGIIYAARIVRAGERVGEFTAAADGVALFDHSKAIGVVPCSIVAKTAGMEDSASAGPVSDCSSKAHLDGVIPPFGRSG